MTDVLFVRFHVTAAEAITQCLALYYASGWRVVSHTEAGGEYSFVLEQVKR